MHVRTTRFSTLNVDDSHLLEFPAGLIGFEDCRRWFLLADPEGEDRAWLQCADRPDIAVQVASPRRPLPDYRVRVDRRQLDTLRIGERDRLYVLVVLNRHGGHTTANLRAPLIINLDQHVGRQVVTVDAQPLQVDFPVAPLQLRKSA